MQKFTKTIAVALVATIALLTGSAIAGSAGSAEASPAQHMRMSDTGWD